MRWIASVLAGAATFASALVVPVPLSCNDNGNCIDQINGAISTCVASNGPCTVLLYPGVYGLRNSYGQNVISINNARDLAIMGSGPEATTVALDDICTPFNVFNATNFTFSGFSIDMARTPFTLAEVASVSGKVTTLNFDATTYPIALDVYPWLARVQGVLSYDAVNQRVAVNATDIYALDNPLNATYLGGSTNATMTLSPATLRVGDTVILRHQTYGYNTFDVSSSRAVSWLNVSIYAAAGMGILTDSVTDVLINGLRVERKAGRPMSINADGMHFSNTRGGSVIIRNSLFEGQGDDGMNIPTLFNTIASVASDGSSVVLSLGHGQSASARPGDTLNFFDRSTMGVLGTAVISSIGSNGTVQLLPPGAPVGTKMYDLVNSAQAYAGYVEVTNNTFRNNRARGALLKSSNVFCANNVFEYCSGSAVKTEVDGCYWMEGHPVSNWTMVNNTITGVNYGPGATVSDIIIDNSVPVMSNGVPTTQCVPWASATPAVQHDVTIAGNVITQTTPHLAVQVYSTDGIVITGNTVYRAATKPAGTADFAASGVSTTNVAGNTCVGGAGGACNATGF